MSFLYPIGLLGLIGIPILIFIYVIKNKYTEQTVSSTYLWTLSERFLKRKKRVSRLAGILSLILQILAVTLISLLIAHPVITVPNAANGYCFILDASGSMHTAQAAAEGSGASVTRFEAGKRAIADLVDDAVEGSDFTLVCVGDTTDVVFEGTTDKEQVALLLDDLSPSYSTVDLSDAMAMAQSYFSDRPSTRVYLVTDKNYDSAENLTVLNMAEVPVENYAVSDVLHTLSGGELTVTGKATSYTSDATVTVELYLNGGETATVTETLTLTAGEPAVFTLTTQARSFSSIRVNIPEADALPDDNQYILYDVESEDSYNTLLVSERPLFLESQLRSILNADIDVMTPEAYVAAGYPTGYGLYVFDSVDDATVPTLPVDGAVWLVNVAGSIEGTGYSAQGEVTPEHAVVLEHTTSSASATQTLVENMMKNDIYVTRYVKNNLRREFSTLLSYKGNPVVFAGANEQGNREVVIGFDLHNSNLPLLYDFSVLMRNLLRYSFPDMITSSDFLCGEDAVINVLANCKSIRVESPSGEVSYLNTALASDTVPMTEVGTYTVQMMVADSTREFYLWSAMPTEESDPMQTVDAIALQGQASETGFDGTFDPVWILFVTLAVIFLADWMVYCYEKYQLR